MCECVCVCVYCVYKTISLEIARIVLAVCGKWFFTWLPTLSASSALTSSYTTAQKKREKEAPFSFNTIHFLTQMIHSIFWTIWSNELFIYPMKALQFSMFCIVGGGLCANERAHAYQRWVELKNNNNSKN